MATEYSLGGVGDEEADGARAWGGESGEGERSRQSRWGGTGRGREGRRSERGGKRGLAWGWLRRSGQVSTTRHAAGEGPRGA